jgi:hypothetical protein
MKIKYKNNVWNVWKNVDLVFRSIALTVKFAVFWDGGLVRTDASEERFASIFSVEKIRERRKAAVIAIAKYEY